jgi:hypothetical protein
VKPNKKKGFIKKGVYRVYRTGVNMAEESGNMGLGIFVGFILMAVIGWVPIIGALIAGIVAGAIARGATRGLAAGFIAGIVGLVIIAILLAVAGATIAGPLGAMFGSIIGLGTSSLIAVLGFSGIVLVTIGGLVGGALRPQSSFEVKTQTTTVVSENKKKEEDETTASLRILKRRYAKGEITKKEYDRKRKDLEKD